MMEDILIEDDLLWRTTFDVGRTLMEDTFDERWSLIEDKFDGAV